MGVIWLAEFPPMNKSQPDVTYSSEDYGIVVEVPPQREFPARNVSSVNIPGKSGNVILDTNSYANVYREYSIAFGEWKGNYLSLAEGVRNWLSNASGPDEYYWLQDSYESGVHRMARFDDAGTFTNIHEQAGRINIRFNCKPQRYLDTGRDSFVILPRQERIPVESWPLSADNNNNPLVNDYMPANPYIVVQGLGDALLTVNGVRMVLRGFGIDPDDGGTERHVESFDIDCDRMNVFHTKADGVTTTNKNKRTVLLDDKFPVLVHGDNYLSVGSVPSDIQTAIDPEGTWETFQCYAFRVYPRWWKL